MPHPRMPGMSLSRVARLDAIRAELQAALDRIEAKDEPSEADEERAASYEAAIEAIVAAIEELEDIA